MFSTITALFRPKKKKKKQRYSAQIEEDSEGDTEEHVDTEPDVPKKVLSQEESAVIIQCMVRRLQAVRARDDKWRLVLVESETFWSEEKRLKEKMRIALQARGQVYYKLLLFLNT